MPITTPNDQPPLTPSELTRRIRLMHDDMRDYLLPFLENKQVSFDEKKGALLGYMQHVERLERWSLTICTSFEALGHGNTPPSFQAWLQIRAQLQRVRDRFGIQRNFTNEEGFRAISRHLTSLLDSLERALGNL